MKTRTFTLHWKTGEVQTVSGPDLGDQVDTLSVAMHQAGIGGGAMPALDYWREVESVEVETAVLNGQYIVGSDPVVNEEES